MYVLCMYVCMYVRTYVCMYHVQCRYDFLIFQLISFFVPLSVQRYLNAICQIPGLEGMRRDVIRDDEQVNGNFHLQ